MPEDQSKRQISVLAITPADAARLLAGAGWPEITEAMVRDDIAAGAPTNADGTVNLVHYAAWLLKEMGRV